jgi:16S rRNA (adenine1518-N6/adenine1519-N6)-dimethyltransferase
MNLASKRAVQNLFKKYRVRPSKRLGQNFLIDKRAIKKLIRAANLRLEDIILEIGPGIGNLTVELAEKVKKVIAVEKDPKMVEIFKEALKDYENVEIIRGNILKLNPRVYNLKAKSYKIVGNLPFYLTAPVIRKFLEAVEKKPYQMTFVAQKEVGQRICAKPPRMNILAVSVQFYAKPEIASFVSKKSFWPQPKVDSAILQITPLIGSFRKMVNAGLFFKIVRAGFSQPRKQLINNLTKGLKLNRGEIKNWLLKNNIQPNRRAETLAIEDWLSLTKSCKISQRG